MSTSTHTFDTATPCHENHTMSMIREWETAQGYQLQREAPGVGPVRWFILKAGKRVDREGEPEDSERRPPRYAVCYTRKKDALARIKELEEWEVYLDRLFAQDYSRVYIWTDSEWKQIEEMAQKLRDNEERWNMGGKVHMRELSRECHWKTCVEMRRYRLDTARNNAVVRRVMAARHEAHRLAGVEL